VITDKKTLTEKTLSLLEYPQIMERVSSHALSEEAAAVLRELKPVYDSDAEETKAKVKAIYAIIKSTNNEPRSWLPSIGFLLPKTEVSGVVFDLDEVLAIGLFIERAAELRNWIIKERTANREQETTGRQALFAMLRFSSGLPENTSLDSPQDSFPDCGSVAAEIFKIVDREGNLRDIPVLRAIRKRIESLEKELKTAVSRYSSDDEYKRMLQSPLPSQRDGRAVIAVKVNFRGRIRNPYRKAEFRR